MTTTIGIGTTKLAEWALRQMFPCEACGVMRVVNVWPTNGEWTVGPCQCMSNHWLTAATAPDPYFGENRFNPQWWGVLGDWTR